jgi:8-oxo-dGTP diphosphatase
LVAGTEQDWVRKATGSAVVITNGEREVLVLRRAYPPHDWVLPGGNAEAGESPLATATREVLEETSLRVRPQRLTGVYYQADHRAGEFIHFVFRCALPDDAHIVADPVEVAEFGFFAADHLPEPMSPSTRRRLLDALAPAAQPMPITLPPSAEG